MITFYLMDRLTGEIIDLETDASGGGELVRDRDIRVEWIGVGREQAESIGLCASLLVPHGCCTVGEYFNAVKFDTKLSGRLGTW